MENKELEEDIFKYDETEFHKKCDEIIKEISTTFKHMGFTEKYIDFKQGVATKEDVEVGIHNVLINLDEYKRNDLNHMWAMLSDKNCWAIDYKIGEIVHNELMKIWYPEDYEKQNYLLGN